MWCHGRRCRRWRGWWWLAVGHWMWQPGWRAMRSEPNVIGGCLVSGLRCLLVVGGRRCIGESGNGTSSPPVGIQLSSMALNGIFLPYVPLHTMSLAPSSKRVSTSTLSSRMLPNFLFLKGMPWLTLEFDSKGCQAILRSVRCLRQRILCIDGRQVGQHVTIVVGVATGMEDILLNILELL